MLRSVADVVELPEKENHLENNSKEMDEVGFNSSNS